MPTVVEIDVDTGGLGSYTALETALSTEAKDLTVSDEIYKFICRASGGAADTTLINITGWTTDATRYIWIVSHDDHKHAGTYDTAKYRLELTGGRGFGITVASGINLLFDHLQLKKVNGTDFYAIRMAEHATFKNCLCDVVTGDFFGVIGGFGGTLDVYNCCFYNSAEECIVVNFATSTVTIENSTFVDGQKAVEQSAGTCKVLNCVASGQTVACWAGTFTNSDYNVSSDATSTGGANDDTSKTVTFVDSGANNYLLSAADAWAKDKGTSGVTLGFTDDVIGTVRPQGAAWDRGWHEVIPSASKGVLSGVSGILGS